MFNKIDFEIESCRSTKPNEMIPNFSMFGDYVLFSSLFNIYNINTYGSIYRSTLLERTSKSDETEKESLNLWLDDIPLKTVAKYDYCFIHKQNPLEEAFKNLLRFKKVNARGLNMYHLKIGKFTLFRCNNTSVNFICALVVPKKYIKYVKLCILLNQPILEDCFEFWYSPVEIAKYPPKIGKAIKSSIKYLQSFDIPCFEISDISSKFKLNVSFKAVSISQEKQLLNDFANQFLQSYKQ